MTYSAQRFILFEDVPCPTEEHDLQFIKQQIYKKLNKVRKRGAWYFPSSSFYYSPNLITLSQIDNVDLLCEIIIVILSFFTFF